MTGGDIIGEILRSEGVSFLFTLCGGHISPILLGAKSRDIRVVDVRDEANAVFAADAVARLTGTPGVAAVTAGPGLTNTITAVKNAQLAQSPVVILGGATATLLKGRGSLQDIDQRALMAPHVKWLAEAKTVRDLAPMLRRAFQEAAGGVPGPVFLECPVDLLYDQQIVEQLYLGQSTTSKSLSARALQWYLKRYVRGLFRGSDSADTGHPQPVRVEESGETKVTRVRDRLRQAQRPVLLLGSQAVLEPEHVQELVSAVEQLGIPVYLSGMARGLLGANHPLHLRHKRRQALKAADVVILAGVVNDFRLDYGRSIAARACLISVNRCADDLMKNRRPTMPIPGDPGRFVRQLARGFDRPECWDDWHSELRQRDTDRNREIESAAGDAEQGCHPLELCRALDARLPEHSALVADGGDFVGTASYVVQPRGPLRWLDPGLFGTLGVGAGFALGTKLCYPDSEVWILYGDGSVGFTLSEFDTFARHRIPVIALVGNDACWSQIAREQVEVLNDDVGCRLARTDYHLAAEALGGKGILIRSPEEIDKGLDLAQRLAAEGWPVLVNAWLAQSDFRKGSISL